MVRLMPVLKDVEDAVGTLGAEWLAANVSDRALDFSAELKSVLEAAEKLVVCDNCHKITKDDGEIPEIQDAWERVSPGELYPAGECPSCGSLVHPLLPYAELGRLRRSVL